MLELIKISTLPAGQTPNDADQFAIVQAGQTVRVTKSQLATSLSTPAASAATVLVLDVTGSDFVQLPAGTLIQSIVVTGDGGVKVGTAANGGELLDETISVGTPLVYSVLPDPFFESAQSIFFTGTAKYRLALWNFGE